MQDIAYKIWKKLADNIEKIVLCVMLVVFPYHLFLMFQEVDPIDSTPIKRPTLVVDPPPPIPPLAPMIDIEENYSALVAQNFFTTSSSAPGGSSTTQNSVDIGLEFLDIQETAGVYRVQLKTASAAEWYAEGDKFEDFELQEINPETETVVVYATKFSRVVKLSKEQ